jgi:hypothetical protein
VPSLLPLLLLLLQVTPLLVLVQQQQQLSPSACPCAAACAVAALQAAPAAAASCQHGWGRQRQVLLHLPGRHRLLPLLLPRHMLLLLLRRVPAPLLWSPPRCSPPAHSPPPMPWHQRRRDCPVPPLLLLLWELCPPLLLLPLLQVPWQRRAQHLHHH